MSIIYTETRAAIPAAVGLQTGRMVSIVVMVRPVFGTTAGSVLARVDAGRAMHVALGLKAVVSDVHAFLPPCPVMALAHIRHLIQRHRWSATTAQKVLHRSVMFTLRSLFPVGNPAIFPYVVKLM